MLKAISTHIFLKQRLHAGHLETLAHAGAEGIEVFAARQHFDYTSRQQVREIANWFRDHSLRPWALHAPLRGDVDHERGNSPSVNVVDVEKARRIDAMDEVKRALESAEQIPFSHMILHLGERGQSWSPRTLENAMAAIEHLGAFARPLGVQILLENLEKNEVTEPQKLIEILSIGHFDDIGICLDLGHANLNEGVASAISTMGERILSVHVHDNKGDRDAHLWPGDGTIPWPQTMQALQALPNPPATVLEIHRDLEFSEGPTAERLRKAFEFLDAAARTHENNA